MEASRDLTEPSSDQLPEFTTGADLAISKSNVSPPGGRKEKLTITLLKSVLRENSSDSPCPSRPVKHVTGGKPSVLLFVNRDLNYIAPVNKFDEVFPGVFIGDESFARDKTVLRQLGITHIVNAAQGEKFCQIDTSQAYYADLGLTFLGIKATDTSRFKLATHFQEAADFIHAAVMCQGRVAVHCHMGMSRSASLVLAYLMIHHDLDLVSAIRLVRPKRAIFPNDGFLSQLITLDESLRNETGHRP